MNYTDLFRVTLPETALEVAALLVLVDLRKDPQSMPDMAGGLRLRYMRVNRLHITRSKLAPAPPVSRCAPLPATTAVSR